MNGRFITFEGGEGAGKSTQVRLLAEHLRARGLEVVTTREPGGTPTAEAIRDIILSGAARELGADGEAILFAAARADHVDKVIRPALARGAIVLCDRFIDSTRVYQGTADGAPLPLIRALERIAIGRTRPDLTIILDLPAAKGLKRAAARSPANGAEPDRFERDTVARHELRRKAYVDIATRDPRRCVLIDADRPPEAVAETVRRLVDMRLAGEAA